MKIKFYFLTILSLTMISCNNTQKSEVKNVIIENQRKTNHKKNSLIFNSITKENLPKEILFEGKIKDLIKWQDKDGSHIVLATETGFYTSDKFTHENEGSDAELFAYHYLFNEIENKYKPTWKVYDFISDCPVDIEASFIKNTFQITDLNTNGIAEVWLMYKKVCHGDVSPCEMKIIMYEGKQKYAMRGENKVQFSKNESIGGNYELDSLFIKGDKEFREFAKKLWNKNIIQKWGE